MKRSSLLWPTRIKLSLQAKPPPSKCNRQCKVRPKRCKRRPQRLTQRLRRRRLFKNPITTCWRKSNCLPQQKTSLSSNMRSRFANGKTLKIAYQWRKKHLPMPSLISSRLNNNSSRRLKRSPMQRCRSGQSSFRLMDRSWLLPAIIATLTYGMPKPVLL